MWMGAYTTLACLARAVGPILVSTIYRDYGTYAAYGMSMAAMAVALLLACATYRRLVPFGQGPHFENKQASCRREKKVLHSTTQNRTRKQTYGSQ